MSRLSRAARPALVLAALLVVLGVGVRYGGGGPRLADEPAATAAMRVPLASATAVCPDPASGAGSATTIGAATGDGDDRGDGGTAATTDLSVPDSPRDTLGPYGTTLLVPVPAAAPGRPVAVRASGGAAPGLAAAQFTRTLTGDLRGLAAVQCTRPETDFWFVGSSTLVGERSRLYLSNPTPAAALVELVVYGDRGVVPLPGGRQIAVPAGAQRVVSLDAFVPDLPRLAVHVLVRQGRIAAALRDQRIRGVVPEGVDWLPPAAPPASRIVVPGIGGVAGTRMLQLLVPGETDAIARVRLVSAEGTSVPERLDVVEARAGSVTQIDITALAGQEAYALELSSDVPLTASVLIRSAAPAAAAADFGYTAAAAALAEPAVVPYVQVGASAAALLMLASESPADMVVEVTFLARYPGRRPAPAPLELTLAPRSTSSIRLPTAAAVGAYGIRVSARSEGEALRGALLQSERTSGGAIFTVSPLVPVQRSVDVPAVTPDLGAALP